MGEGGEGSPSSSLPGEVIAAPADISSEDTKATIPVKPSIATKHLPALDALAAMSWTGELPKGDLESAFPEPHEEALSEILSDKPLDEIPPPSLEIKSLSELDVQPDPNTEFARKLKKFKVGPYLTTRGIEKMLQNEPVGTVRDDAIRAYVDIKEKGVDSLYHLSLDKRTIHELEDRNIFSISELKEFFKPSENSKQYFYYETGNSLRSQLESFDEESKSLNDKGINYPDVELDPDNFGYLVNPLENRSSFLYDTFKKAYKQYHKVFRGTATLVVARLYSSGIIDNLDDLRQIPDLYLLKQQNLGTKSLAIIRGKYPYIRSETQGQPSSTPMLDSL